MKGVFMKVRVPQWGDVLVPVGLPAEEALRAVKYGGETLYTFANGHQALEAIKAGKVVIGDIKGARNPLQLNMFWALIGILVENSPKQFPNKEIAKIALCRELGYVDVWFDPLGRMQIIDKSIATESMEQAEFNAFFQAALDKICEHLGTAPQEVQDRVHQIIEGQSAMLKAIEKGPDPHDPRFAEGPPWDDPPKGPPGAPETAAERPSSAPVSKASGPPAPNAAPAAAPPPPPAAPTEAAKPAHPDPTTPDEYEAHMDRWLARCGSEEEIEHQWLADMDLRNVCGIRQDRWTHLKAKQNARIRVIRSAK